jgi:hypothetical protein
MSFHPLTIHNPMANFRLPIRSSKPCYNGFTHEFSSPYYLQSNGQVEVVKNILKTIIQWIVNKHKTMWKHILCPTLWFYRTSFKNPMVFTPFHFVHGVEVFFPIECQIPTLWMVVELQPNTTPIDWCLISLESTNED